MLDRKTLELGIPELKIKKEGIILFLYPHKEINFNDFR